MENMIYSFKIKTDADIKNENAVIIAMVTFVNVHIPNMTSDRIGDIKTCISEAFRNAVKHGFPDGRTGIISVKMQISDRYVVKVTLSDNGVGIADVKQAQQAFFTTGDHKECSGMGFSIMESFSKKLTVRSSPGKGTVVSMVFDYHPALKRGMVVYLSGDSAAMGIKDYNVRVCSPARVLDIPFRNPQKVLLLIDHIDGDHNVSAYVDRKAIRFEEE